MNLKIACLFGGALVGGGLVTSNAVAQSFDHDPVRGAYAYASAYNYDSGSYSYSYSSDYFADSDLQIQFGSDGSFGQAGWDRLGGTWFASATQASNVAPPNYMVQSRVISAFTVDEQALLIFDWDFSQVAIGPFFSVGRWVLSSIDSGGNTVFIDGYDTRSGTGGASQDGPVAGSTSFVLDPSMLYLINLDVVLVDATNGGTFAGGGSVTASLGAVPTPGAVGVFFAGGAMALRRRRR